MRTAIQIDGFFEDVERTACRYRRPRGKGRCSPAPTTSRRSGGITCFDIGVAPTRVHTASREQGGDGTRQAQL